MDAFQTIKCYSESKKWAVSNFQRKAATDVTYLLCNINFNRLKRYFLKYRAIVKKMKFQDIEKMNILKKIDNVNLRDGFRRWKNYNEKVRMAE